VPRTHFWGVHGEDAVRFANNELKQDLMLEKVVSPRSYENNMMTKQSKEYIRIAAVFEAAKGSIVLITGFGLLLFIHKDLHLVSEQIVRHLHLNPARHYPTIFIDVIDHITEPQFLALALSALLYAVVRLVEAYGLWYHRRWAEWFGFLTGGMYIPVEIYELARGVTAVKLTIFIVNLLVVALLGAELQRSRK
jgi:uncharacterized membrane protein (DUF2068 family)